MEEAEEGLLELLPDESKDKTVKKEICVERYKFCKKLEKVPKDEL